LLLPVALLLMAMFTLGIALFVSTLAVFFVDVVDVYGILLSAWFYLTPIIYPLSIVPEKFAALIRFNPMNILLEIFRSLIYYGEVPSLLKFGGAALMSVVSLLVGWWVFTRKVDEFAYRI
jgi:ABC-type polysaccharide/polyol phosphate export permease